MKSKNCSPLRMADGGMVPIAPSPFSIRGMVNGLRGTADAVASRFQTPAGYTPASQQPMAPAPVMPAPVAPAPAMPQLGGMNMGAMQQREAAAGLADGAARIVPGQRNGNKDTVPAMLTPEEAVLPVDTVDALGGPHAVADLIDRTHTPVKKQGLRHFANGLVPIGDLEDLTPPRAPGTALAEQPYRPNFTMGGNGAPAGNPNVVDAAIKGGNPNVPPGGMSAEAQAFNASRVGPQPPVGGQLAGGAAESSGLRGALRSAGEMVDGSAVKSVLGKAGGVAAAGMGAYDMASGLREGDYGKAGLGAADTAAAFSLATPAAPLGATWLGGRAVVGGIGYVKDRMGAASDAVGGTINQMLPEGMRVNDDALNQVNAEFAGSGATAGKPKVGGNQSARYAFSDVAGGGRGSVNPPGVNAIRDDNVPQLPGADGSSQGTGVEGAAGVRKFTKDGKTLYSNVAGDNSSMMGKGGTVTQVPGEGSTATNLRAAATYRSIADAAKVDPNQQLSVMTGWQNDLDARNAGVKSTLGPTGNLQARQAEMEQQAATAKAANATTIRGQDINAQSAAAQNAVATRGQDLTASTTLRGQDVTARGQDMTARTAAAAARVDQMNKDRQFGFDVQKYGTEQATKNFEMRTKASDDVQKNIVGMLPPGPDGKPDATTAARYHTALNGALDGFQRTLEQRASKGDPNAAKQLEDFKQRGMAALDQKDVRAFINGMKAKDLSDQYASGSFNPFGGTGTVDDRPATGLRKTSNGILGFGGEYSLVGPDGKLTGATVPSRAVEGDGSIFGGNKRNDLRDLIK